VPTPNYGYEKRQKELAKKKKKEEKLRAKADRKAGILPAGEEAAPEGEGEEGDTPPAQDPATSGAAGAA
jgi:hypothetical protein